MARITTEGRRTAWRSVPTAGDLAVGSDGAVTVWDWENQQLALPPLRGHAKKGISVAFSRDGRRLASGSWSGEVMIWDAETGQRLLTLSEHRHPVSAVAFSRDGRRLVSACFDRHMVAWDVTTGRRLQTFGPCDGLVLGVAISPDGSRLASAGEDKTVRSGMRRPAARCSTSAGTPSCPKAWPSAPTACVSPRQARTGPSASGTPPPCGGTKPRRNSPFQGAGEVWTMAVSPDGHSIASAGLGSDTPVKVWDAGSGQVTVEFAGHESVVFCVAWHPDGQRIASSGWDVERKLFIVKVWYARTGEVGFELPVGTETYAVAFSRDGEYLVTGSTNGTVQVWDTRTGRQRGKLGTHTRPVRGLVFSRDGRRLASASGDGVVKLWDWDATRLGDEQKPLRTFRARVPTAAMTFAFSPDGRRLVVGGEENTVHIWDLQTEQVQVLRGHSGDVWATAFSPDPEGRWVASAGQDSTVKVWDTLSGKLVHSFAATQPSSAVSHSAPTADGCSLGVEIRP